jgi:surface antigen
MTIARVTMAVVVAVSVAACQSMQDNPKQTGGTLIGAVGGALAGSQFGSGKGQLAAVAIGALGGAWLGSEVGKSLDKADRMFLEQTRQTALEAGRAGQTSTWRNPDSGHAGTITPGRTYQTASRQDCREYYTTITIDGRQERAMGRACRQADGTWKIVQ